jgi:hypothetical protein
MFFSFTPRKVKLMAFGLGPKICACLSVPGNWFPLPLPGRGLHILKDVDARFISAVSLRADGSSRIEFVDSKACTLLILKTVAEEVGFYLAYRGVPEDPAKPRQYCLRYEFACLASSNEI